MPATRLNRGLVALAASAISAVYVAGYFHTQAADESLTEAAPVAAAVPADPPTDAPTLTLTSGVAAPSTTSPTPFVITDGQVEQDANAQHITWDAARAQLEAAGGIEPTATTDQINPVAAAAPATPTAEAETSAAASDDDARPVAAAQGAASTTRQAAPAPTSTSAPRAAPTVRPTPAQAVAPTPTRAAAATTASGLKDGTFTGAGSSPRGGVQVSLAVQSGKITSVTITRATTEYPSRLIAGLPAQVVSRQSAQVDTVSGATFSTQAFKGAVQQALNQAHA